VVEVSIFETGEGDRCHLLQRRFFLGSQLDGNQSHCKHHKETAFHAFLSDRSEVPSSIGAWWPGKTERMLREVRKRVNAVQHNIGVKKRSKIAKM
jgi:hypothetical protein